MTVPLSRSRVRVGNLVLQAVAGLATNPVRTLLAAMGTVIGVGSVVAVLGLTATANAQIDETFTRQSSTLITVELNDAAASRFPAGALGRVQGIDGVVEAAVVSSIDGGEPLAVNPGRPEPGSQSPRVRGVTPDYWDLVGAQLLQGRLIDERLADQPVAVLGARTARRLGIEDLSDQVLIEFRGTPFLVVGITGEAVRDQVGAGDIAIPQKFVRGWLAPEYYVEQMLVTTRLGAGEVVAQQVPPAVSAFHPNIARPYYASRARVIDDAVSADLRMLFLLLAFISMGIAGLGIVNVSLMAVRERRREIGVRRALGARRHHIVSQFLIEASLVGLLGGALGGAVGQAIVIVVSAERDWTPTLEPTLTLLAAPFGLLVGVVAGLYPAIRAALVPPAVALRASG